MDTVASREEVGQRSLGAAEREIERFIERQSQKGESDPAERDALWKESMRVYHERRRRQMVAEWFGFYCRMADNHRALCEHYEARAEALCEADRGEGVR